jgi:uncharacterized protein YtpQ (UPF0354 family)
MSSTQINRPLQNLSIEEHNFEAVREFTYLGVTINNENKIENEISRRLMAGNRTYFLTSNCLNQTSNILSKTTKVKLYKKTCTASSYI